MAYSYTTFVAAVALESQIPETNGAFQAVLPTIIDQAEQRIYRDLNLLSTIVAQIGQTTGNQRNFTLPSSAGTFVVLETVNLLNNNARQQVVKISRDAIDMFWPSGDAVGTQVPVNWAPLTDQVIILGPAPSGMLDLECIGTIRPAPLSVSNPTTFLSTQLPDLLLAAAMSATSAYQQNWGRQADDPASANSWENDYKGRLPSALGEEVRRKFAGWGNA